MSLFSRFSRHVLRSLQSRVFFQYSQKRARRVEPVHKFPEYSSSFKNVHLDSIRELQTSSSRGLFLDTDLEQYVVPRIDSDVLSNPKFDVLKFGCISDPGVRTFVTKLHEVVMNSSKKIGRDETLTDTLVDDLLRVAKFNAFPLMIRNKPRYELYVGDYCVVAKPEFLIKSQDNVLVAVEEKHLDIVRPSSGFGEPQLAIEILSSGSENSRTYYDEKLGYFKDQTVFAIRVISTYVTFYKAMIPAKYWNELEKGYPEEQSIEILRWPARDLKDSGFDLAEPDGRKKVLPSLINIRQSLLQSIRNN
ncbi:609_t:CDS:2, partial [Gigaspora rosea]